jgi:hypothetical protein
MGASRLRSWLVAGVVVAAVTTLCWVQLSKRWSRPHATHAPAAAQPSLEGARLEPPPRPVVAPAVARATSTEPTTSEEAVLRRLEQLSRHDKHGALAEALVSDPTLPAAGTLAEARKALIVTLLVDTQRMPEARERARTFLERFPSSRYAPLVRGVTGIYTRPRPSESKDARP